MNRFGKIMHVIDWVGIALFVGAGFQGRSVEEAQPAELARHSILAIAAAGFCLLPRFWTLAYLVLASRGRRAALGEAESAETGRVRRQAYAFSIGAIAALLASFALAGAVVLHRQDPLVHAAIGGLAVALQVLALVVERRALVADAGAMVRLDAAS